MKTAHGTRIVFCMLLSLAFLMLSVPTAFALHLRKDHPTHYVVKEGDSLWRIAQQFLDAPCDWHELYHNNPSIKNPDKIYPGATLTLGYLSGKPYLHVSGQATEVLSPHIVRSKIDNAIPAIALSELRPFLNASLIFTENEFPAAPYIVAFENKRMVGSDTMHCFARGVAPQQTGFGIYHQGEVYRDPQTNEVLGLAAMDVGRAEVLQNGDLSTLMITQSTAPIAVGDFLFPPEQYAFESTFTLKRPDVPVQGQIVAIMDGLGRAGAQQVVVVNKGLRNGVHPGDVLSVINGDLVAPDPYQKNTLSPLPNLRVGEMMIFRSFERASFALVMRATDTIHVHDRVINPE